MKPIIAILMGSKSDYAIMEESCKLLDNFGIGYDIRVSSAHRSPKMTAEFVGRLEEKGFKVVIAAAGMAAHLPGVVAAYTTLPVIGVPIDASPMGGLDALLSIVQMPPGVPVATVAIGRAGAKNSAILALQMLSLEDKILRDKLKAYKSQLEKEVMAANEALNTDRNKQ